MGSEPGIAETVEAPEVGVTARGGEDALPFEFRAGGRASPLIVSFPHVGLDWPDSLGPRPQVNFPRNADYAVDRLYVRAEALGAATLRARYSRLVVDLNRARDDVDADLVPDHPAPRPRRSASMVTSSEGKRRRIRNRGVIWASAIGNLPLFDTLSHAEFVDRIERFHRPYYRALELLVERRRQRFGYAVVLDAHSMPGTIAGDLVLGTRDGAACDPQLRDLAARVLSGRGQRQLDLFGSRWPLTFAIDDPYRGGEITGTFGRPEANVHALQLEVNRSLYMDEYCLETSPIPDPRDLDAGPRSGGRGRISRAAQGLEREQRRLRALVSAIDTLLMELSVEREWLAERTAAE